MPLVIPPSPSGAGLGATNGFAIAPNDTQNLPFLVKGIWVGGAGIVVVVLLGGDTVTLAGVPAGTLLNLNATKVFSTGTTATLLVGLY